MQDYASGGRTNAATDAAANAIVAQLWNPSSTVPLYVREISVFKTAAGGNESLAVVRTSARGATPGSTITPGIAQHKDRVQAPASAAVIETSNMATEATIDGQQLAKRAILAGLVGAGIVWTFVTPITVRPGAGIAIAQLTTALAVPICEVNFDWSEPF